jgi:hypothetical protein
VSAKMIVSEAMKESPPPMPAESASRPIDRFPRPANQYTVDPISLPERPGYTVLAFSLPHSLRKWGGQIKEITLDSTWNTNHSNFELFALLGEVYGSGCPIGFLLIRAEKGVDSPGTKTDYIAEFLQHFSEKWELDPDFALTDKDFSEINACRRIFPSSKHQLCFWHCLRALKTRLSILRRQPAFYDVEEFLREFGEAADKNFVPLNQNPHVVRTVLLSKTYNTYSVQPTVVSGGGKSNPTCCGPPCRR